ncbi:MAG: hypothetical protein AAF515_04975 [Pseudomonadota bacterium]
MPALYDVKDLAASYDGTQLVFAMRAPDDPDLDEDEQPTWNLWLFDTTTDMLTRLIESDVVAEEGHDVAPRFLPDGRIVFASTRQRRSKAILLDEGKPQFSHLDEDRDAPATALHVMDPDGSNITQITFNQSSDMYPAVLGDGRIVYSRWDNIAGMDRVALYSVRPDGREQALFYGPRSADSLSDDFDVDFMSPLELPDGRVFALLRSTNGAPTGALPVSIDTTNFVDNDTPVFSAAGLLGPAQELLITGVELSDSIPLAGRYASIAPLFDGTDRLLVSWSQCRLTDGTLIGPCTEANREAGMTEAAPLYGVWVHDLAADTQQPIVVPEEGEAFVEAVVLESRQSPDFLPDGVPGLDLDADLVDAGVGVLNIRSVYDIDGTPAVDIEALADPAQTVAADRPARYLRLVKAVSMADDDVVDIDNTAFGRSQAQLMREVLGYAPIAPDGSVQVQVPANVAFTISVVDADGKRISPRHENWLQLRPGEVRQCVGCHDGDSAAGHGRPDAQPPSGYAGAALDGSPFPNTDPTLFANAGETMAEVDARINGIAAPSVDLRFSDIWTDPALRAPDPDETAAYADLSTVPPVAGGCTTGWSAACRIVVNYEASVHPVWNVDRQILDVDGVTVLADRTCNTCHSPLDPAGVLQVPAANLDLADGISADEADHFKSYRELLFPDSEQTIIDGALQDLLVQATDGAGNPLFQVDDDGQLILDEMGEPIPVLIPVDVAPPARTAGALASDAFFAPFAAGGSHDGYLSASELKLISEWLDVGAQYYNNPFDVPP